MIKKVRNKIWSFYNDWRLGRSKISHGGNTVIHGHLGLRVQGTAIIGNNCYISSGSDMNPLCARDNGFICVEKAASLIIGDDCAMSSPRIWAHQRITIGNAVMLGGNVTIVDSDCHSLDYHQRMDVDLDQAFKKNMPIIIEDNVFIGMNSTILKGVTIGARSVIGACSVVTTSIPADCLAAGNPAKIIKSL